MESIIASNLELYTIVGNNANNEFDQLNLSPDMIDNNPIIQLPFPPNIEPKDLIINKKFIQPNGKHSRAPNAFIIYRKAFVKAAREQGYILPMTAISSMASAAWEKESTTVKEEYKRIAKDAHKLIKEMFPKKSNQRKRKEKWNLVSFQDKSPNNNADSNNNNNTNINSSEITELKSIITPILVSPSSSPNLSEVDGNFSEEGFTLQQQSINNNFDEFQISDNYLIDTNLSYPFQDYNLIYENYQITDLLNQFNQFNQFENTSMDNLKFDSQSTLNMTLVDALGMEGFNLGY